MLALLLELSPDEHLLAAALDAAEAGMAAMGKRELSRRAEHAPELPALRIARSLALHPFARLHPDLLRRHWRLERWYSEPPGVKPEEPDQWYRASPHARHSDRAMPNRPPIEVVIRAFEQGAAGEADLVDHLVGPRGPHWSFRELGHLSSPRRAEAAGAGARTLAVVERIRERVIAVELARGEAPTQAAEAVRALSRSGGLDVLAGALTALGRERFVRGWSTDGEGRASVFSHMIATSFPAATDSPERFATAMREARISDRRLREVACYAPQWASHVEATLGAPGLADAVWWLHAHTKDDRWSVDAALKAEWERSVGDRTELSAAQLMEGAVDVRWFAEVRERVGDAELEALLGAAKYGSTAGGHKRAELFARAMRGDVDAADLLDRISSKRHQDSVRALGLLPLAPAGQEALARRYEALQRFRRESRKFGRQRQASEGRATDIGLENLARTAGFTDPARLTWAMEAAATADLAGDGAIVEHDDVTVRLRVDVDGRPDIAIRRGEDPLKSVPAKLRKVPEIKALTARATELRRQGSRIRGSLEQAMVRGDRLTGDELARYREHLLLWPALSRLVVVGEGICGYPDRDGRVLRDHAGGEHAVGSTEVLRIAHPLDLLETGDWPAWQRDLLERRLVQPFKQAFRELYLPVDAERTERGDPGATPATRSSPGAHGRCWRAAAGGSRSTRGRGGPTTTRTSRPRCGSSTASAAPSTSSRRRSRRSVSRARETAVTWRSRTSRRASSARRCETSTSSSASLTSRASIPRRASPAWRCEPPSWRRRPRCWPTTT